MHLHLEVYDPADPDAPPLVVPEGIEFSVRQPEGDGTIDPQWGKVGDKVRVIDGSGYVVTAFTVVERSA